MKSQLTLALFIISMTFLIGCASSSKNERVTSYVEDNQSNLLTFKVDTNRLLINQSVPIFKAVTINGAVIDSSYFKRKVTLINFMYIGCEPCVNEAFFLRHFYQDMKFNNFQMLCIAPQTAEQMKQLASYSIPYPIIAECSKEDVLGNPSGLGCKELSNAFQVSGYPVILLVDKKGIIRYRHEGFNSEHPPKLNAEIENLLR